MVGALVEELASDVGRRIQPTYGYYKQANGWVTISTITSLEKMNYIKRGWKCLDQYGAFDMTPYVAAHPFEGLFMFGGVHEMPAEQVLQTGLYMNPPVLPRCRQHITQFHRTHAAACWRGAEPVEFPQMASLPPERVGPFQCQFCARELPTMEARGQHQTVMHQQELGSLRTGQSVGESLAAVLGASTALRSVGQNDEQASLRAQVVALKELLADKPARPRRKRKAREEGQDLKGHAESVDSLERT